MVWAKSPLGCSTRRTLRNSRSGRRMAKSSSVRPFPLELPGMCVEGTGHPEMIQGDVAQGDVLFELGRPRDPLTETLGQDQVVIGVSDQGTHRVRVVRSRCPLGSGGDDRLAHM